MRRPAVLIGAATTCIIAGAVLMSATWQLPFGHALYCSLGIASTEGCDVAAPGGAAQIAAALLMLTALPLLGAAFGQLHLDKVRDHVDTKLGEHHRAIHDRLDRIEHRRAPDAPPQGGT